jgi:hypothetical protein
MDTEHQLIETDTSDLEHLRLEQGLGEWVAGTIREWRDHYEANYDADHQRFYRAWRGIYDPNDKTRDSERSRIISPALQQAVESNVAEIETATFNGSKIFDIEDDFQDQDPSDVVFLRNKLHEDLEKANVRPGIGEVLVNAAVFGTGIAEIVMDEAKEYIPATQPIDGEFQEIGVTVEDKPLVRLLPVQPKNFLIDPSSTSVDDAMGVAIEEMVPLHKVEQMQESGVYRDVFVGTDPTNQSLEKDEDLTNQPSDRVRVARYYGLVPRDYLIAEGVGEESLSSDSRWQEAVVVIANDGVVLKATANPYMCQDRPVVAFPWDTVPGRFWGRGVCEKGYSSQQALNAELRARIDALALTTHPMMAVDAASIPRGSKLDVRPGRMILTNGPPQQSIQPFKFGQVDQITFSQAQSLQMMLQQATGAVDGAGMAQNAGSHATSGGVSMSLGAVMKRQRRTLVNFQDTFLRPFIKKAAWRYMQFSPDQYPVKDYKFKITSSLGVVAREYEVGQLSQILQVVPPGTPQHSAVIKAIIEHLNVSNREELIQIIDQSMQPNPQAQQAQQQAQQAEMAMKEAQMAVLNAQAAESQSRAKKYSVEADIAPKETVLKYIDTDKDGVIDSDVKRKMELARLMMDEDRWNVEKEEKLAAMSMAQDAAQRKQADQDVLRQMLAQNEDVLGQVQISEESVQ